jgi:hypothetical protein
VIPVTKGPARSRRQQILTGSGPAPALGLRVESPSLIGRDGKLKFHYRWYHVIHANKPRSKLRERRTSLWLEKPGFAEKPGLSVIG